LETGWYHPQGFQWLEAVIFYFLGEKMEVDTSKLAAIDTMTEMLGSFALFESTDLEGMFANFVEGGSDEV
jgi:hypothetical protein